MNNRDPHCQIESVFKAEVYTLREIMAIIVITYHHIVIIIIIIIIIVIIITNAVSIVGGSLRLAGAPVGKPGPKKRSVK